MSAPMSFEAQWRTWPEAYRQPGEHTPIEWAEIGYNKRQPEIDSLKAELEKAREALVAAYLLGAKCQERKAIELEQDAAINSLKGQS